MSAFWLTLGLLLVAASALLLLAGRRRQHSRVDERDALNKTFYQQRLQELEQDEALGVVAERGVMVQELQQTLLTDIPQATTLQARPLSRWVLVPGVLAILVVSLGAYLKVGGLPQLMLWQQVKSQFPALQARVMDPQAAPLSLNELAHLGLGLRSELQNDPDNVSNWMMLGRIGMVLNNATTASQAFRHAMQLQPDNLQARLSYAEVMTRSGDVQDQREAEVMLQEMLKNDSRNLQLLGLLAFNGWQQQHYDSAITYWQQMLVLLPPGDRQIAQIERSITQAKSAAGEQNSQLALTVSLSAAAEKMLPTGGVLYISVSDGVTRLPVAVKKLPLSHFPLSLTLDDSNAIMPERLLSAQHQIQVQVRISRDGSATPQPGDWQGQSALTPFDGHQQLKVEINQQR
ncbi:c-type cytochrome biogenesis protein CcmI [Erwinia sp. V71]|uniref:c-type cytochrome biogenesis protein CcmI n=1 Tax=Erwinia sp. V71 TaxID=3369424 RepID=UPI003F6190C6